ncbi:MAG: CHASE domain-containing protein [Paracoccaceae bacterium]
MRAILVRIMPQAALVAGLGLGAVMTFAVYSAEQQRLQAEFERSADLAVDLITSRLDQHVVVLRAAKGLFSAARGRVARDEFLRFIEEVDIVGDLSGVQGVGFARVMAADQGAEARAEIAAQYGLDVEIRPPTDQALRAPIVLLEPDSPRNMNALGYDMYVEPVRRAAMDRALATGKPQMSGPVVLVQETEVDRQTGFLVYLAYGGGMAGIGDGVPREAGFVYAPFRGDDLVRAALAGAHEAMPGLMITDEAMPDLPIHGAAAGGRAPDLSRSVEVLGRNWRFDLWQGGAVQWHRHLGSLLVGLVSILFASAAALAISARQEEAAQARELAAAARRESEYRGLLLQEMKHRIKNHIARIQSIARQSARGAVDVKAFTTAFDARLQAMAAVQEILAGTLSAQADLGEILRKELQQCLDTEAVDHLMEGPPVILDERQAHAFAIVAHELVTNAMKYGGLAGSGGRLRVDWRLDPPEGPEAAPVIALDWIERFAGPSEAPATPATGGGFGSRLIEASLEGELAGTITRDFGAEGLHIRIRFAMNPDLVPKGPAPRKEKRRRRG